MACCLPCVAYGKTEARRRDPTLSNYSPVNGDVSLPKLAAYRRMQSIRVPRRSIISVSYAHSVKTVYLVRRPFVSRLKLDSADHQAWRAEATVWHQRILLRRLLRLVLLRVLRCGARREGSYLQREGEAWRLSDESGHDVSLRLEQYLSCLYALEGLDNYVHLGRLQI